MPRKYSAYYMTLLRVKREKRDKTAIEWSEAAVQAFQTSKNSIAQAVPLAHPNSEAKLSLVVDASNIVADAFSHIDEICIPSKIDYEEIARAQADDDELLALQGANSNLVFKTISLEKHKNKIIFFEKTPMEKERQT
ncbi:hypothetical protein AVEN_138998-1 [Araneus ventricosus]|uniref:Reverse transcriptase/retrotransposon-derived protein RNase H-like domain-containing protein n=1 Tax=Araneus ventricosus TaxID=182803 RepID=A0A4Y2QDW8_ARAVE|nr:hypothetical protein AVEN_138998-1 [Araneus ventricosus]